MSPVRKGGRSPPTRKEFERNVLGLFDTCGYIFGPAIMLAGAAALAVCGWQTFRRASERSRRLAIGVALSPTALALCGVPFGIAVGLAARAPAVAWPALGKMVLAGVVVSAVPLVWALFLRQNGGPHTAHS
jgi:hypothetical protein